MMTYKIGDNRGKESGQNNDDASNNSAQNATVANVDHLTLDELSKTLFQHESSFSFDVMEAGGIWRGALIGSLKRRKERRRKVKLIVGIGDKEGVFCSTIKSNEMGCRGRSKDGVLRRVTQPLPLYVTSSIVPQPKDEVTEHQN
jgi:hypothetical protein